MLVTCGHNAHVYGFYSTVILSPSDRFAKLAPEIRIRLQVAGSVARHMDINIMRWFRIVAVNISVIILILVFIEGLTSYVLFARDATTAAPLAERRHTQYDPDLGWSNIPGINIPDMYGPGISLSTNSQGFRNDNDFEVSVPAGSRRLICSGDSFTLGYGVDNDQTWCHRLSALNHDLETVNMGQGGYGADQAYLWYMRDGLRLEHDVHIFAFITDDFYRMQRDRFLGYSKPVIAVEDNELVIRNTPVPRSSYTFSVLTSRLDSINKLRTVEFFKRISKKFQSSSDNSGTTIHDRNRETRLVLRKIFEALRNHHLENGSKFVLVYLPTRYELKAVSPEEWVRFVRQAAADLEIPYIDIMSKFRMMDFEEASGMFISAHETRYPGASGHLNQAGNETVAGIINEWLADNMQ